MSFWLHGWCSATNGWSSFTCGARVRVWVPGSGGCLAQGGVPTHRHDEKLALLGGSLQQALVLGRGEELAQLAEGGALEVDVRARGAVGQHQGREEGTRLHGILALRSVHAQRLRGSAGG